MKEGGKGGDKTYTGLLFEQKVSLRARFEAIEGYTVVESASGGLSVHYGEQLVGRMFQQHAFYSFLKEHGVDWKTIISSQLLPDDALLVVIRDTLFIIEIKSQKVGGSIDEKLQTCDFKRKQYIKLIHGLGLRVEYVYVLSDWYRKPKYRDVLEYIHSVNCHYMFNEIPLRWFGLPDPRDA